MKSIAGVLLVLLLAGLPLHAELYFLDLPNSFSLKHGEFSVSGRLQSGGGVMARAGVGLFNRLTLGLSYGVDGFFGNDTVVFPPLSAFAFQARLLGLEEGEWNPSILVGFETQGYDGYDRANKRFYTLPPGGYLLLAKTFWTPRLEISIGANYLPPLPPGSDQGFSGHIALREFYFTDWDFIVEYDMALNDQQADKPYKGLLNLGLARRFGEDVSLKFGLRDLLGLHSDVGGRSNQLNRVLDIAFQQHF